jgi:hypothetical protein
MWSGIIDSFETATGIDLDGNGSLGPTSTRAEQRAAAAAALAAKRERLAGAIASHRQGSGMPVSRDQVGLRVLPPNRSLLPLDWVSSDSGHTPTYCTWDTPPHIAHTWPSASHDNNPSTCQTQKSRAISIRKMAKCNPRTRARCHSELRTRTYKLGL